MINHEKGVTGRRKQQRWGMPSDRREPLGARIALLLMLINIFMWIGFRDVDMLIISLVSLVIALIGLIFGYRAGKRIARHGGRITGENMARIGYWGNVLLFVGSLFLFSFTLILGILSGDLL